MIEIWIDGLCQPVNPGGTACYGYIIKRNRKAVDKNCGVIGIGKNMTNNVAEYTALICALREVKRQRLQNELVENELVVIKSDSKLLVNQMNRKWKVKAPLIKPLYKQANDLAALLNYRIEWVPREENQEADRLARIAYERSQKMEVRPHGA
jgi:ribonuclease HI